MVKTLREWEKALSQAVDTDYSYGLARRMEGYKSNAALGYRTAGSRAEWETGEMILREMQALGLSDVHKDRIEVDGWEFEKAVMRFTDKKGREHEFQLGAYQTDFHTHGFERFSMVYLGNGTAESYRDADVKGKLVLVDINQRDGWWINFPVYQARLKGAAALVAVQDQGYGEIHDTALNAQDIAGPEDAAAFSISRSDADIIRTSMKDNEAQVLFDAQSTVKRGCEDYNIVGCIPGQEEEGKILLTAHYDSYFSGFQDDNAAVAMMLGIAGAILDIGYRPRKTLIFCAMAAEEWGVAGSKYDWSAGAYEQVFSACPGWQGQVIADLNFELPAHAHGRKDGVRCTYEYVDFLEDFLSRVQVDGQAYPDGVEVVYPIQTWSDDFSMAIAGIPSMVNDFSSGEFMETHYHSQYDNEDFYQEPVYRFHHELYGRLVLALDQTAVAPLDFRRLFEAVKESVDPGVCAGTGADQKELFAAIDRAAGLGGDLYGIIKDKNRCYREMLRSGREEEAGRFAASCRELNRALLGAFRKEQDCFVRLNWQDEVLFPQEAVQNNLKCVSKAIECLGTGDVRGALEAVYGIDNNRYAFLFDREVFCYFTEYVLNQPACRLKWGAGRIVRHENLFGLVTGLKDKLGQGTPDLEAERQILVQAANRQELCYRDDIKYMTSCVEKLTRALLACMDLA